MTESESAAPATDGGFIHTAIDYCVRQRIDVDTCAAFIEWASDAYRWTELDARSVDGLYWHWIATPVAKPAIVVNPLGAGDADPRD